MKPIRFSRHARRRMQQRGFTEDEIMAILRNPERVEPSLKDRLKAFGPVLDGVARVTFRETPMEFVVVTVVRQGKAGEARL